MINCPASLVDPFHFHLEGLSPVAVTHRCHCLPAVTMDTHHCESGWFLDSYPDVGRIRPGKKKSNFHQDLRRYVGRDLAAFLGPIFRAQCDSLCRRNRCFGGPDRVRSRYKGVRSEIART